mmetsp:Transcript_5491/g.10477  ORF Transcript_5491/g.10477 Transcript_5491/m.10477 type:complete len:377 (-) Transcript_5491:127-1257(-)
MAQITSLSPASGTPTWTDASAVRDTPFLEELCHLLPKVELHQHLTGSMPNDALRQALAATNPDLVDRIAVISGSDSGSPDSLPKAWDALVKYCDAVAVAVQPPETLEALFGIAIGELAQNNVRYVELRIGLKPQPTKRQYLDLLENVIRKQRERFPHTTVRLLISLARHRDPASEGENIEIAIEYFTKGPDPIVCGVELGGVATVGAWRDFEPLFRKARAAGLPIALHCGEDKFKQAEWQEMLAFAPDRLGHCVHLDSANMEKVVSKRLPVEACLTCHLRHFGVEIQDNVFGKLFPTEQVVLGTDNPSLYESPLSKEYELCCKHHGLLIGQLFALARRSVDFTFQTEEAKSQMRAMFELEFGALRKKFGIQVAGKL